MASTNLCTDFTNRTLYLNIDGNESISSIGSITSLEDDESFNSRGEDDGENPGCFFQRRRSIKKSPLSHHMTSSKLRPNLTAPDLKLCQYDRNKKSISILDSGLANARWVSETTRSFSNMNVTPNGSKTNMRKSKSLDETGNVRNDRWIASSSTKLKSKITNEILDLSGASRNPVADNTSRWSSSVQAPSKLTTTRPIRVATYDQVPGTRRCSSSDLNTMRRCVINEPRGHEKGQGNSNPIVAATSMFPIDAPPRHPLTRNRSRSGKRCSAPDLIRRRSYKVVSPDESSPDNGVNARWHSSAGSRGFTSLDVAREPRKFVPVRALSRWDSSSSFTVASGTSTSMDQLSTKPRLPRRRPRREDAHKTTDSAKQKPVEPGTQNGTPDKEPEETQPVLEVAPELKEEENASNLESEEAAETTRDEQEPSENKATATDNSGSLEIGEVNGEGTCGMEDDSTDNQIHLGFPMAPCTNCFDTIPEEDFTEEEATQVLSALLHQQCCDSMLKTPKRRKSEPVLADESDLSVSLKDSSAVSISLRTNASSSLVLDCGPCNKRRAENQLHCFGPGQPKRRGSADAKSHLLGSAGSTSSLRSDLHYNDTYPSASVHHQQSLPLPSPGDATPRPLRRSSTLDALERHPFSGMCKTKAVATSSNQLSDALLPLPRAPREATTPKPASTPMNPNCPAA